MTPRILLVIVKNVDVNKFVAFSILNSFDILTGFYSKCPLCVSILDIGHSQRFVTVNVYLVH